MFREINALLASEGMELEDISSAASYLLKHQFAFSSGSSSDRKVFNLIAEHSGTFDNIFALFGFSLVVNHEYGYVGYLPSKKKQFSIPLDQSHLLLVLRVIYHRERVSGNSDNGRVLITGSQLIEVYKDLIGRADLDDNFSKFMSLITPIKNKRIIKLDDDKNIETGLPNITIMPSIEIVVDEEFANGVLDKVQEAKLKQGESDEA